MVKSLINVSCYNTYDDDDDVMSVGQRVPYCRMSLQSFDGDSGRGCSFWSQSQMHNERKPLWIYRQTRTPESEGALPQVCWTSQLSDIAHIVHPGCLFWVELNPSYFHKPKNVSKTVFVAVLGKSDVVICLPNSAMALPYIASLF